MHARQGLENRGELGLLGLAAVRIEVVVDVVFRDRL